MRIRGKITASKWYWKAKQRSISRNFSDLAHPSAKDILWRHAYRSIIVFLSEKAVDIFGEMAWANESWKGNLFSSSLLAWKHENTRHSSWILRAWVMAKHKSTQIQLVTAYHYLLGYKTVCNNKKDTKNYNQEPRCYQNNPKQVSTILSWTPPLHTSQNAFAHELIVMLLFLGVLISVSRSVFLHESSLQWYLLHGAESLASFSNTLLYYLWLSLLPWIWNGCVCIHHPVWEYLPSGNLTMIWDTWLLDQIA